MKKTFIALAASLALSSAFAQSSAPVASSPAMASDAGARSQAREARTEQRIAELHAKLKITSAQDEQWNKFAEVMRDNGHTMSELYKQRMSDEKTISALDDMKQYEQITQAHADGTKRLVDAFEPLYASMTPEQKKLADASFHQSPQKAGGRVQRPHHKPSASAADSASTTNP